MSKTIHLQNINIRRIFVLIRPLLPPLLNLLITRQQSVALSTAGKSEMQRIWCTQLRHRSYVSRAYKDLTTSRHQVQRLEELEKPFWQLRIFILQWLYQALHQCQIAGAEDGCALGLQVGTHLKSIRSIFNKIDDDMRVQINPLHGFYSSTCFSHESRSICRYASTSSRVGGGASDGKTCRTLSSVPMTRSKEPRGNGVPFSSNKCAVCVCEVSCGRRRHLDRMSRARSSGRQRRSAACSRSRCHSRSSTSIISRGIVSPTLFYHTEVASSTGSELT